MTDDKSRKCRLSEFRDFIEDRGFKKYTVSSPHIFSFEFPKAFVFFTPDAIGFADEKAKANYLYLSHIESIEVLSNTEFRIVHRTFDAENEIYVECS